MLTCSPSCWNRDALSMLSNTRSGLYGAGWKLKSAEEDNNDRWVASAGDVSC